MAMILLHLFGQFGCYCCFRLSLQKNFKHPHYSRILKMSSTHSPGYCHSSRIPTSLSCVRSFLVFRVHVNPLMANNNNRRKFLFHLLLEFVKGFEVISGYTALGSCKFNVPSVIGLRFSNYIDNFMVMVGIGLASLHR